MKFSSKVLRKTRRLARVTGCVCTPFYNEDTEGDLSGPHIHVKARQGGSVYENYVETPRAMQWAAWRRWTETDKVSRPRPIVKRVRKVVPSLPVVYNVAPSCDEFVEINPDMC